jgi:hypothetical protein
VRKGAEVAEPCPAGAARWLCERLIAAAGAGALREDTPARARERAKIDRPMRLFQAEIGTKSTTKCAVVETEYAISLHRCRCTRPVSVAAAMTRGALQAERRWLRWRL